MQTIALENVGEVVLRKSKRAKRIILKIDQRGKPIITIPAYMPYALAKQYAKSHITWFQEHVPQHTTELIVDGMRVGRQHYIQFRQTDRAKPTSRVSGDQITIHYSPNTYPASPDVQNEATKAATRALRKEAELTLPSLLYRLAQAHGYNYQEVRLKAMHTRWGSCSQNGIINLSIWLVQLPDHLIEYVLCHELVHLHHQHHQPAFWQELGEIVPDYKQRRIALRDYNPTLLKA